ncbi:MAG TPA: tyrosine--tRNA ligase [Polyangia bacterium]|nr:tyrosine--tRNA ligase [Polyangia bacterium]
MSSFVEELTWRGLTHHESDPSLAEKMRAEPFVLYAGFDPSADSLHIGHLLPVLALKRAQQFGHRPIAVVGGATGMIGDPSGKTEERKLLSPEDVERNAAGLRAQLGRFLDFGGGGARLVNNYDWFKEFSFLDFLRRVGKHFSVNMMLGKESVRARLEDREHGISYTEFSYMLIQSYDFLWLNEHHGCRLQIGGSDQWGNITTGIDLIRRVRQSEAFGIALPLVTDSSGKKFGKTEKGAVWLDAARTSAYELYQYFIQCDDRDVGKLLRFYTFLDEKTIVELDETVRAAPEKREAQRVLAREVTTLVHGAHEAAAAEKGAGALFSGDLDAVLANPDIPSSHWPRAQIDSGLPLIKVLSHKEGGLLPSVSAARREIENGGIYINGERVSDIARNLTASDLQRDKFIVLRRGKKNYHVVRVD